MQVNKAPGGDRMQPPEIEVEIKEEDGLTYRQKTTAASLRKPPQQAWRAGCSLDLVALVQWLWGCLIMQVRQSFATVTPATCHVCVH